jgi:hypothetical protein
MIVSGYVHKIGSLMYQIKSLTCCMLIWFLVIDKMCRIISGRESVNMCRRLWILGQVFLNCMDMDVCSCLLWSHWAQLHASFFLIILSNFNLMASQRRENLELVEPVHCVCGNISFRLNQVDFYPANNYIESLTCYYFLGAYSFKCCDKCHVILIPSRHLVVHQAMSVSCLDQAAIYFVACKCTPLLF